MCNVCRLVGVSLTFFLTGHALAQEGAAHHLRRDADKEYYKRDFTAAEEAYRKANILESDDKSTFNLGNAIYNQDRYEEAVSQYEKAATMMEDPDQRSQAYFNLGNAHYQNKKYKESVQAYKQALKVTPSDLEAKQNLMLALREMKIEEQQQQQQQDQQDQEENKEQNEQQQQQQQQNQLQQPGSSSEDDDKEQEQQAADQEQKLTKEQAMQLLEIIEEEDRKVQEKMRKKGTEPNKNGKDW